MDFNPLGIFKLLFFLMYSTEYNFDLSLEVVIVFEFDFDFDLRQRLVK